MLGSNSLKKINTINGLTKKYTPLSNRKSQGNRGNEGHSKSPSSPIVKITSVNLSSNNKLKQIPKVVSSGEKIAQSEKNDSHNHTGKNLPSQAKNTNYESKETKVVASVKPLSIPKIELKEVYTNVNEEDGSFAGDVDEQPTIATNANDYVTFINDKPLTDRGPNLINNLPKPFVKQATLVSNKSTCLIKTLSSRPTPHSAFKTGMVTATNIQKNTKSSLSHKPKEKESDMVLPAEYEDNLIKLLLSSKSGDKDSFNANLRTILHTTPKSINYCDLNGWNALHFASDEGNIKIVESLLTTNIFINSLTRTKKTALHLSVYRGYFDITRLLVEAGASLNITDEEKNTPIHICAKEGHTMILTYLLEKNPQVDGKNIHNQNPVELAKNEKTRQLLIEYINKSAHKYHLQTSSSDYLAKNLLAKFNSCSPKNDFTSPRNSCQTGFTIGPQGNKLSPKISPSASTNSISVSELSLGRQISHPSTLDNKYNTTNNFHAFVSNSTSVNGSSQKSFNVAVNSTSDLEKKAANPEDLNKQGIAAKFEETSPILSYEGALEPIILQDQNKDGSIGEKEMSKIDLSSFICLGILGKGSFGVVYLVEHKSTKKNYAMKILSKKKIMSQNLVKYAMTERNVLSRTNHPFIVKLEYAFQTSDKLFLILEYCPCGDLAEHIALEGRFSEDRAKTYLCEVILAISDLHNRNIIFRDLKPDNVVLDEEGHIKLTDFGLSKEGIDDNISTKSFCGSIAYLAPEMIKKTGHGKAVDWYLLGVLFYEFLCGIPPFFTNDKEKLFKNIQLSELKIPKHVSQGAASLLKGLLNKDQNKRLGANQGVFEIINHEYFRDVNWKDVYNRKLNPPKPKIKNELLERFKEPKEFENTDPKSGANSKNFSNWSFINNSAKK